MGNIVKTLTLYFPEGSRLGPGFELIFFFMNYELIPFSVICFAYLQSERKSDGHFRILRRL